MLDSTSPEAGGKQKMWKWRVNRCVMSALPPPGGAAAQNNTYPQGTLETIFRDHKTIGGQGSA